MTEGEVLKILNSKYDKQAYAFLPQVGNGTGIQCYRHADLLVMGLWPSRGLELEGFEIKCNRGDWLGELKKPDKSHDIAKYCDRWWIVVSDKTVAKLEEIPKGWGFMVISGDGVRIAKAAPQLEPEQMSRKMLAAILRQAQNCTPAKEIVNAAKEDGYKQGYETAKRDMGYAERSALDLQQAVADFEKASGIKIREYDKGPTLGERVKLAETLEWMKIEQDFLRYEETASRLLDRIRETLSGIKSVKQQTNQSSEFNNERTTQQRARGRVTASQNCILQSGA